MIDIGDPFGFLDDDNGIPPSRNLPEVHWDLVALSRSICVKNAVGFFKELFETWRNP